MSHWASIRILHHPQPPYVCPQRRWWLWEWSRERGEWRLSLAALELGWLYLVVTCGSPFHLPTVHCGAQRWWHCPSYCITWEKGETEVLEEDLKILTKNVHTARLAHYSTALSGSYQSAQTPDRTVCHSCRPPAPTSSDGLSASPFILHLFLAISSVCLRGNLSNTSLTAPHLLNSVVLYDVIQQTQYLNSSSPGTIFLGGFQCTKGYSVKWQGWVK